MGEDNIVKNIQVIIHPLGLIMNESLLYQSSISCTYLSYDYFFTDNSKSKNKNVNK
jgi:hypothetical protein